ncbi:PhnE/PtxC family ABC transporter permease [Shewanella sp.]|uniref:PhnE/PtxC family ABC transporter permease n=1 Tax=Shewanella sp. TaxID=50422 RepID=UPI0040544CA2
MNTIVSDSPLNFMGYWQKFTLGLLLLTLISFGLADTEVIALEPWNELSRMGQGLLQVDFFATEYLVQALWQTVSFALLGVSLGLVLGAPLALIYHHPWVAAVCAFVRAIHEIFWALLFLQIFGLSALTGILAIGLPYGATFARVFYDILVLAPKDTQSVLPHNSDKLSRYIYGTVVTVWAQLASYCRYRFECALRSSAVLGFIGMPTLGFYLETAFRQGHYQQGFGLLILFIVLIGTVSSWCRKIIIPVYLLAAVYFLPELPQMDGALIWRFLSYDILPPMLQNLGADGLNLGAMLALMHWFTELVISQVLPGIAATLVLAIAALGLTHLLTMLLLPLNLKALIPAWLLLPFQGANLILRSTPEYLMAFIFMLLLGPSMLPAILALALHNAGLMVFLTARQGDKLTVSPSFTPRLDHYCFELMPKLYPSFIALLCYRFEVIIRETAILGMLGVATLGFYVDSQFSEIRYSGALVLLVFTALLNIFVDRFSRKLLASPTN